MGACAPSPEWERTSWTLEEAVSRTRRSHSTCALDRDGRVLEQRLLSIFDCLRSVGMRSMLGGTRPYLVDVPLMQQRKGSATHPGGKPADDRQSRHSVLDMPRMRELLARGALQVHAVWRYPDAYPLRLVQASARSRRDGPRPWGRVFRPC